MQLAEFRDEVRRRTNDIDPTDYKAIPKSVFPLVMEAAERQFGISNCAIFPSELSEFHSMLLEHTNIFGGFCGWADRNGHVHSFGYANHERFRYWFTPDQRDAEETMAHISTSNTDIEDMMNNVSNPRHKTKRMVRGILSFCHTINESVLWQERILRHKFDGSPNMTAKIAGEPTKEELTTYLHDFMPKEMSYVEMSKPYGYLSDVIKQTNDNAMSDREIIKPATSEEFASKFRISRMYADKYEARYYEHKTAYTVGEFQKRLATIGY